MTLSTVLFGEDARWRAEDIAPIAASSAPGIIVALLIGAVAFFAANMKKLGLPELPGMNFVDPLVLAIFIGMLVRLAVAKTAILPKLIPGIVLAPYLFVPFGIILYGTQLRFDQLSLVHPITLVWMLVSMAVTLAFIYLIGTRVLKFKNPFACLLAVGSAVCGASAIAVVSPVVEADPDEMGTALITNTLLVIASFYTLTAVGGMIDSELFARAAGAVLQQTGFVHMAVPKGPLQDMAMAIKTTRVGLLILIIPTIAYIVGRKIFIPWYMILFVAVGFWYSTTAVPAGVTEIIKLAYGLIFTTALASIGLNANIMSVVKRIGQPLILTYVAFLVSLTLFWACESFMH